MIHLNHIVGLTGQGFPERQLRDLFCGCAPPAQRRGCARGCGLGRRR